MFHCKPSIWGYPLLWKPPSVVCLKEHSPLRIQSKASSQKLLAVSRFWRWGSARRSAWGNDTVEIGRVGMAELNAYDVLQVWWMAQKLRCTKLLLGDIVHPFVCQNLRFAAQTCAAEAQCAALSSPKGRSSAASLLHSEWLNKAT